MIIPFQLLKSGAGDQCLSDKNAPSDLLVGSQLLCVENPAENNAPFPSDREKKNAT